MNHQELRLRGIKLQDLGTMQSYLTEHTKKNPDADLSLSYMNHAIENLSSEQLESRVTDRIAQLHLKKRPRWDSIGIEDILVSPSEEFMDKVELCFREEYFQDSLHFFQSRYCSHTKKLSLWRQNFTKMWRKDTRLNALNIILTNILKRTVPKWIS